MSNLTIASVLVLANLITNRSAGEGENPLPTHHLLLMPAIFFRKADFEEEGRAI